MISRRGFVMMTTLWVMSVASVVAMAAALIGREAARSGSTRVELERARWTALACERRAEAAIDDVLQSAPTLDDGTLIWRILPRGVTASPLLVGCDVTLEAAGTRLDIGAAPRDMIANLLIVVGFSDRADELADALEDWRDSDDVALPLGAESAWYYAEHRVPPRNGPLASIDELRLVRGFEQIGGLDSVMTVEPGLISLATAPVSVLMAVPGVTRETAEQIVAMQVAGSPISDLISVLASVSEASRTELLSHYPDAARATTPDPDAWLVRVRVARGRPQVAVQLEWRLIRTGRRCVVVHTHSVL